MPGKAKLYREISRLEIENDRLKIEWRNETLEQADTIMALKRTIDAQLDRLKGCPARLKEQAVRLTEAEGLLRGARDFMPPEYQGSIDAFLNPTQEDNP